MRCGAAVQLAVAVRQAVRADPGPAPRESWPGPAAVSLSAATAEATIARNQWDLGAAVAVYRICAVGKGVRSDDRVCCRWCPELRLQRAARRWWAAKFQSRTGRHLAKRARASRGGSGVCESDSVPQTLALERLTVQRSDSAPQTLALVTQALVTQALVTQALATQALATQNVPRGGAAGYAAQQQKISTTRVGHDSVPQGS